MRQGWSELLADVELKRAIRDKSRAESSACRDALQRVHCNPTQPNNTGQIAVDPCISRLNTSFIGLQFIEVCIMKFSLSMLLFGLLPFALAADSQKSVIVTYPGNTPGSVIDSAKNAIIDAVRFVVALPSYSTLLTAGDVARAAS